MSKIRGFTLVEMVCVVTVLAVIAGLSAPSFRALRLDAVRNREINQWVQAIHLARAEAMKRGAVVTLCPGDDALVCAAAPASWSIGWIAFVNTDADVPAARDAGEPVLRVYPGWPEGRITGNRDWLSFRPFGQTGITATHVFCDARGAASARAVIISQTGRPRVAATRADGSTLTCP